MRDSYNRIIDYMRVSITDRCNLRCNYCMSEDITLISHNDILRYEEILRLCTAATKMGIKTIRVTGGEPLMRKGCMGFIKELKEIPGIQHVTLTTNGVLLEPYLETLMEYKLDGLNISLDSLDSATYLGITGRDEFQQVWKTLHKAVEAGLQIKINCVPLRGINDEEIVPIARLAEQFPIDVRFIELMPTSFGGQFERVAGEEILARLQREYLDLTPDEMRHGFGPARYFKSARLKGGLGLIDAVSNHFCSACNRMRLTSEGFLKLCLFHDNGLDLRAMLRSGASDAEIETAMADAVRDKPEGHSFGNKTDHCATIKKMSRIGG